MVPANRIPVPSFLELSKNALLIDVRSPAEYAHAHLPGALNLPLFDNEERKVVGTAYKQVSREEAIKIGLDYFGPKMRAMVEQVEAWGFEKVDKEVFVYCWRGGMRSGAVAWLLQVYGFKVTVLAGGYKAFRTYALQALAQPYPFCVLGGYTGSGKTELLQELENRGQGVIDLEKLACHKGSAFGNINMPQQPSQEDFENKLALQLLALGNKKTIWIEDESQRIGHINLPQLFWEAMRSAPLYFLDIPFTERLQHLVQEYGCLDKEKMIFAIQRITKRLGGLETKKAIELLTNGDIAGCFSILLKYYDKQYNKALDNRQNLAILLHKIPCAHVSTANAELLISKPMTV